MKNIMFAILLITGLSAIAQDQKTLEQRAQQMINFTSESQHDQLLDYTYPKVFEIVPRDVLKGALSGMMKGDGFTIVLLQTPGNFKFTPIKKIEGGSYSVIDYDLAMKMIFDEPIPNAEVTETIKAFRDAMQSEDVTYNPATNTMTIKKRSQMVGVADASTKNIWTFVNNDGGPLLKKILSDTVRKELGIK